MPNYVSEVHHILGADLKIYSVVLGSKDVKIHRKKGTSKQKVA